MRDFGMTSVCHVTCVHFGSACSSALRDLFVPQGDTKKEALLSPRQLISAQVHCCSSMEIVTEITVHSQMTKNVWTLFSKRFWFKNWKKTWNYWLSCECNFSKLIKNNRSLNSNYFVMELDWNIFSNYDKSQSVERRRIILFTRVKGRSIQGSEWSAKRKQYLPIK